MQCTIACTLIEQDVPTRNNRIYKREAMERIYFFSQQHDLYLTLGYPPEMRLELSAIAGRVLDVRLEEGQFVVGFELMDTQCGKEAQQLITAAYENGEGSEDVYTVAPHITGSVERDETGEYVLPSSIALICWSLIPRNQVR